MRRPGIFLHRPHGGDFLFIRVRLVSYAAYRHLCVARSGSMGIAVSHTSLTLLRAHGVVVSHPLSMREALGSIPSVSISLEV